ncbi:MAG TPA: DUF3471 domain-containing protein [Pyrinomonadaceae bacterium]|nr:DUF3471 domain-containing protein [Pyrinomonadaceae bacterium]
MKTRLFYLLLTVSLTLSAQGPVGVCLAQTPTEAPPRQEAKQENRAAPRVNPEALRKFVGRYELEVALLPVTALDVTLEGGDLWVKPSQVAKRRLRRRSKNIFRDEVGGAPYEFQTDEEGNVVGLTFRFEGESYTARKVQLPPPSLKGNTTFRLKGHADAQVVALAGTFNNWNQSQLLFGREGDEWVCRLDLAPGRYAYKFVVDGNWLLDPSNPDTEEDEAGNVNSVLVVEDKQQ